MSDYSFTTKFLGLIGFYVVVYIIATLGEYYLKFKGLWKKK